jgi:alcohol dehydrogenase
MRAYLLTGYGAVADNIRLAEIPDSRAAAGEVVIDIHAASLNPIDFKLVHGALKRISKYQLPRPIGFDASGVVTSVGPGASGFKARRCRLCPRLTRDDRHLCGADCAR